MSSLRQLRREATQARKDARKACSVAFREARAITTARAAMIKAAELKKAREACERAQSASLALARAYGAARPAETPARSARRARRRERVEFTRRDAIARVREEHDVPEGVAELAVKRAERAGGLPRAGGDRWRELADRAVRFLPAAWLAYERQMGPPGFVPRASKKKRAKKKRGARIQPVGRPISVRKKAKKKRARRASSGGYGGEIIIVDERGDVIPF